MLDLHSARWQELEHAYGSAGDIPSLLAALGDLPRSNGDEEPWFTLWSSLAHQGDVYPASFAAVPHVVEALAGNPMAAGAEYFHFPAWVEICRARSGTPVPEDLQPAYAAALSRLTGLAAEVLQRDGDDELTTCALAAIAAAKGQHGLAEVILEMESSQQAQEVLAWLADR